MKTDCAQPLHLTYNTSQQAQREAEKALQAITDFIINTLEQIDLPAFEEVTAIKREHLCARCRAIHTAIEQTHPNAANMLFSALRTAELVDEACSSAQQTLDAFEHARAMKAQIMSSQ